MLKIKPLHIRDRKRVSIQLEPEIIKLLEDKKGDVAKKIYAKNPVAYNDLDWDRSAYLRRLIIEHLNIELEEF